MAALLGVNIDHVATLRQARGTTYPDPSECCIDLRASRGRRDYVAFA